MNIRTLCLAILYFGDATGYEIKKESTDGKFSHFVDASFGSIYPALARLEADGKVTVREESQPGKPARKIYSITASGREEFRAALEETATPDLFRSPFLLIACCARLAGEERVRRAIDEHISQIREQLAHLNAIFVDKDMDAASWAVDYGRHCMNQKLAYLEANRARLEAIAASGGVEPDAQVPSHAAAAE